MSIYKNQDLTRTFTFDNVTTITEAEINYRKPSGLRGTKTATINGLTVSCHFSENELDQAGLWYIQANITADGGNYFSIDDDFYVERTV